MDKMWFHLIECAYMSKDAVRGNDAGADQEAEWHDRVRLALLIEISCKCPRRRVGVVRLDRCTTPGWVAVAISEKLLVARYDGDHDCVVDEATQDSAVDLRHEHDAGRNFDYKSWLVKHLRVIRMQLTILAQFKVHTQLKGTIDDIVRPSGKVHVANRATGED